jgi:hypothetical protein
MFIIRDREGFSRSEEVMIHGRILDKLKWLNRLNDEIITMINA